MKYLQLTIVLCLLILSSCKSVSTQSQKAGCRITTTELNSSKGLILENSLVKAAVFPGLSGKILGYTYKPTGEVLFMPLNEEVIEFAQPPIIVNSNFAGYKDMIWEYRFSAAYRVYKARIIADTLDKVAVELTWQGKSYRIVRTVALSMNSTALNVSVTMTSLADKAQKLSYWKQITANITDTYNPGRQIAPLAPAPKKSPRGRAFNNQKTACIYNKPVPGMSNNYFPSQPWWAWQTPGTKLVMGEVVDDLNSMRPDGFFYSHKRNLLMTQETIFGSRVFKKGQSRTYSLAFVAVDGLTGLDYLSRNLAAKIVTAEGYPLTVKLQAAAPRYLPGAGLKAVLLDSSSKIVAAGAGPNVDLSPKSAIDLSLPINGKIKPGKYQLALQLACKGKIVETAVILGRVIEVK
jgi:hypothetical protein